jgi:hypothetical protein
MKKDWLIWLSSLAIVFLFSLLICQTAFAETNTVSSTVVTNNTPPTASAPTIMNNNSDICKVGVGGSIQNNVLGIASGIVIDDELCQQLKLSRSLYAYGMKVAAVSVLCQDPRVFDAMTDAGTPCPYKGSIGVEAQNSWVDNPEQIPDGSKYKPEYVQIKKELQPKGDSDDLKNFSLLVLGMLLFVPL